MAAITICSDFGAPINKVWHCFPCFPIYFPWSDGNAMIFVFWMLSFKSTFPSPLSLSSSSSLVLLHFLPKEWCHLHIWVNSRSWWWTGRPGMVQFIGLQGVGHDWVTEVNWTKLWPYSVAALLAKPLTCSGLYPVVWRAPSRKTSEMTEWDRKSVV